MKTKIWLGGVGGAFLITDIYASANYIVAAASLRAKEKVKQRKLRYRSTQLPLLCTNPHTE